MSGTRGVFCYPLGKKTLRQGRWEPKDKEEKMRPFIIFISFCFINAFAQDNSYTNSSTVDTLNYNNEISVFSDGLYTRALFTEREELICTAIFWSVPAPAIAQKIDKNGNKLWGNQDIGTLLAEPVYPPEYGIEEGNTPYILPAPDGGAYFAYVYSYFGDCDMHPAPPICISWPFLQKVDANGNPLWGRIGRNLSSREVFSINSSIIQNVDYAPDGDVMVYYWWSAADDTIGKGTYVQKVDAHTGELKFGPEGKKILNTTNVYCIISKKQNYLLYGDSVLCVDKNANKIWSKDLLKGVGVNYYQKYLSNDSGDLLILYNDRSLNVLARLFDSNGECILNDKVVIKGHDRDALLYNGNEIKNWGNDRWLFASASRIQSIDKNGNTLWGDEGIKLPGLMKHNIKIAIINDTSFYCATEVDTNAGEDCTKLYLYKINENGNLLWGGNGVLITEKVAKIVSLFADQEGNAYIVFESFWVTKPFYRPRGTYVQKVDKDGKIGFLTSVKSDPQNFVQTPQNAISYAYPNPFKSNTTILVKGLQANADVKIKIFDLLGKEVASCRISQYSNDGVAFNWDGRDQYGRMVSQGVYFYQVISSEKIISSGKILLGGE